MTLLDAKDVDPEEGRKRKKRFAVAIVVVVILLSVGLLGFLRGDGWWFWYWPEEHVVGHFFSALQKQDYKAAYGIWMHDASWAQHPEKYPKYPFNEFYRDWGPGGEWGLIKTQKVYGASTCSGPGSGVVVDVVVNDRAEHAQVWVEKSDHTLSFPPCELIFH
jgi:hypothetical protein